MGTAAAPRSKPRVGPARRLGAALLVLVMGVGSVALWLANPIGWLVLGSHLQTASEPSLGIYVGILIGIVVTATLIGLALGRLNRAHARLTGRDTSRKAQLPWHRSLRGDRHVETQGGVLESVMIVSVALAVAVSGVWFFAFAGSSLPT